ncbi:MAG: ChaN family lipoprotein [Nitrospirota bacterium]|nr:ChaN family lipoprotein [Nitrospirota bacterium]
MTSRTSRLRALFPRVWGSFAPCPVRALAAAGLATALLGAACATLPPAAPGTASEGASPVASAAAPVHAARHHPPKADGGGTGVNDSDANGSVGFASFAASSPYRDLDNLPAGTIVHVASGRELSPAELMDNLAGARVVYVGEMHTSIEDHRVQLDIIRALDQRSGGRVMVGMEMFQHTAQPGLDRWVAGDMDEAEFLRLWYDNWSEDFAYYADILRYARDRHIPLIALNATGEEVRQVSTGKADVPAPNHTLLAEADPYQKAYMKAILGGHEHAGSDGFGRVQRLWESTMAEHAANALDSERGQGRTLVVLAGSGHVQYGFGIPRQLYIRRPLPYRSVVPVTNVPENRDDLRMEVAVPDFPFPVADFVWSVDYRDREGKRMLLGVALEPDGHGMTVRQVLEGTAAEGAGVLAGDHLVSLDGHPLGSMSEVRAAMALVEDGHRGQLVLERGGVRMTLGVTFRLPLPGAGGVEGMGEGSGASATPASP